MPKSRVQTVPDALSPAQAAYVLERLVADRRISQAEVNRYAAGIGREIRDLETRLSRLQSAGAATPTPARGRARRANGAVAKAVTAPARARTAKKSRRTAKVTAEQMESRKLQGRYLSLIRRIPANKRAQYTKLASEKGRESAIREMKAVLGK